MSAMGDAEFGTCELGRVKVSRYDVTRVDMDELRRENPDYPTRVTRQTRVSFKKA